jgi:hypothetical protein
MKDRCSWEGLFGAMTKISLWFKNALYKISKHYGSSANGL